MEKEKTSKGRGLKTIKLLTMILVVVLIALVGFVGIYSENRGQMINKVAGFKYLMDFNGARNVSLKVQEVATDDGEEVGKIEENENVEDVNNEKNYEKSKQIIEKRLKDIGVEESIVSLNKENGEILVQIPEDDKTDEIVANLYQSGKFEIIDTETKEVLLNNDDIKTSKTLYNNTQSGTVVYLEIDFNKEGKRKLEEISKTYVKNNEETTDVKDIEETEIEKEETSSVEQIEENTENEEKEEKSNEKTITMKINDEEIMSTSFEDPILNGKIQLSVGSAATDNKTLEGYASQASKIATQLKNGKMPVNYSVGINEYILSDVDVHDFKVLAIAFGIIIAISLICLVVKYKLNGLLAAISYIGFVAAYALIIRYANVKIAISSFFAVGLVLILNYIFVQMFLKNIKQKEENAVNKATTRTYIDFFVRSIPACIIAIALCFVKVASISSFGMVAFWGLVVIALYNFIITKVMFDINNN